jgi:T5SS/PEP-CTERM-associated repeat protein
VIGETGSNNFAVVTGSGSVWSNGSANGTMVLGNGANSINNGLTVSQGGKVYSAGNPAGSIGLGVNANSNSVTVTDSGSLWNIAGTLTVGASGASNNLTVSNGGQVTTTGHAWLGSATNTSVNNSIVVTGNGSMLQVGGTVSVGSNTVVNANTRGIGGNILVQNGGTLEGNILVSGAAVGGVSSGDITNNAGIYQFTSPTPSIIANTASNIAIAGGTISFRNVASASVYANVVGPGNQLTNMAFSGNNTFRLNNSSNTSGVAAYNFDSGFGATNYHRLELVNGTTLWRSSRLNIGGTSGSMLVSNTTARIAAVVTNQGSIQVVNSIATWSSNSVVSGAFITDPSTNIFQANLTVTSSGYLSGGAGDLFQFESDFTLQSTQDSLFALDSSTVLFTNGVGQHVFDLTGSNATDDGTNFYGLAAITTNFAIGSFIVAPTDTLRLTGAVFNALYVGALDFGGLSNTNNLTLDVNLYYDSTLAANSYLASTTYDLAGAGMLIPYPGIAEIIPEPSSLAFLLAAGCGLLFRRARGTHTAA